MAASYLRLLTWNIQSGRGCDGKVLLDRIILHIHDLGLPDVICLQEVARHFNEYVSPSQPDQLAELCSAFRDYTPVWGPALSWPGRTPDMRQEFGNLTLVKQPLLDQRVHSLPNCGEQRSGTVWQTPRSAVEAIIDWHGPLRILNTHLAYHDEAERFAQLSYLHQRSENWHQQTVSPAPSGSGIYHQFCNTKAMLLCGDLNLDSRSEQYRWLEQQGWEDAFRLCHTDTPHTATCGIHDQIQWPQGAHCRDYIWLRHLNAVSFEVDTTTQLSDHQPLIVTLEPPVHDAT